MNRAWTVEHLVELHTINALSTRLLDGSNETVWAAASQFSLPGTLWPVVAVAVIESVFMIITTAVTVIRASILTAVVIVACRAIGPGSLADFFLVVLFGFFSISVLVSRLEHLAGRCQWLPIELPLELIVMIEPLDKAGDYLGLEDVRNLVPYF